VRSPLVVVLDSNGWDPLLDDPAHLDAVVEAVESGRLRVLVSHVQLDQLAATPGDRGHQLLLVVELVDPAWVATSVFVLDFSPLDEAALADDDTAAFADRLRGGEQVTDPRHIADAVLAVTAHRNGATFITSDRRLSKRCALEDIATMTVPEFLTWTRRHSGL
jgi:predicted nucleic acid-binding protein